MERLKRHYNLFKDEIEKEEKKIQKQGKNTDSNYNVFSSHPKVGRNDPCPCGSRLRFKKCCMRSGRL
ncbi:SEC-C metal-binding domain-containing protein [uncultured Muriicola sp.]|uniref:SEC-C metal-binding domain-containing protein n=1 Tax=uncultured Muriicola sp. TaxID=1583102 RepID=UPI00345B7247